MRPKKIAEQVPSQSSAHRQFLGLDGPAEVEGKLRGSVAQLVELALCEAQRTFLKKPQQPMVLVGTESNNPPADFAHTLHHSYFSTWKFS